MPNQSRQSRGTSQKQRGLEKSFRRLVPRCRGFDLVVPTTYEAFEDSVKRWIATCVSSRTLVRGVPVRREVSLVEGNQTLMALWQRVSPGSPITIVPAYFWSEGRVERIEFSLKAAPQVQPPSPPPAPPPTPSTTPPTTSKQAVALRMLTVLGPHATNDWAKIALCVVGKYASGAKVDGRYLGRSVATTLEGTYVWGNYPATLAEVDAATFIQNFDRSLLNWGKASDGAVRGQMQNWVADVQRGFSLIRHKQAAQGLAVNPGWLTIARWLNQRLKDPSSILSCF